ncbi:MAG: hypothetical protein ABMA64_20705 [Myxococcota bacterium]
MVVGLAVAAHAGGLGPSHTLGLRYRHGFLPRAILDGYFYDADDEGALPYERPAVRAQVFGLEYTLDLPTDASFVFWFERFGVPLGHGYWDDVEKGSEPVDHLDGDYLSATGLGGWVLGANYSYDAPIARPPTVPIDVFLSIGGGIGLGPRTGELSVWHPGYHPSADPTCLPEASAPQRYEGCSADEAVQLPGVFPVLDLTLAPKVVIAERAMVRLDLGLHDVPYVGVAAGGTL